MRRVLFVTHSHSSVQPGGVETYVDELMDAMAQTDVFEPWLVARVPELPEHTGGRTVPGSDPRVRYLRTRETDFDPVLWRAHDSRLHTEDWRALLAEVRPDVIHFHHSMWLGYEALHETRRALPDTPIVYTLHEFVPICHHHGLMVRAGSLELCDRASPARCHECFPEIPAGSFRLRRDFILGMLEYVDQFLAPSRFLRDRYVEWGLPADRIRDEPNGRIIRPRLAESPAAGRRRRIGLFGQLHPFKGVELLLQAVRILEREDFRIDVLIRGANLDFQPPEFQQRIRELLALCAASVRFDGGYRPEELPALLAGVDWAIVPSIGWENSPLVIQEALMHGRPVICADVGGMAEKVRDGVDGLHFRRGDPQSLADTIRHAVSSPGLWDQLNERMASPHPIDQHIANLTGLYEELLMRRHGMPALS